MILNNSRFVISNLVKTRCIHTSAQMNFKFKLTEEMSREFEEKQKAKLEAQIPPEKALHTRESSLIMGRVSHERYKNVVKIGVPKHRFNDYLNMYIREQDNVQAFDEKNECKPGDWVLLRRTSEPIDVDVEHKIEKVVYQYGNYIDPITKRRSLGLYFDDDMEKLEKIKLDL